MTFSRFRRRLLIWGLRRRLRLEQVEAKAIAALELTHLSAMAKVVRRLGGSARSAEGAAALFPILTRNQELPKRLAALRDRELSEAAAEILGAHAAASEEAGRNGTLPSDASAAYGQVAALLAPRLPGGLVLLREVCLGEVQRSLARGWHPQLAGAILLHRFLGSPAQYLQVKPDPSAKARSAAPYRPSASSPIRGR